MAEYYSEEYKVATNTSDDAVYVRQERDISMMRTLNLSQLFHGLEPGEDTTRPNNTNDNLQPSEEPDVSTRRISFPPSMNTPPNSLASVRHPAGSHAESMGGPSKEKEVIPEEGSLDSIHQPPQEGDKEQVLSHIFAEVDPNYQPGETKEATIPQQVQTQSESEEEAFRRAEEIRRGSFRPYVTSQSLETVLSQDPLTEPSWKAMDWPAGLPSSSESSGRSKETQDSHGSGRTLEKRPTLQWAPLPSFESDSEIPSVPRVISSLDSRKVCVPSSRETSPNARSSVSIDKSVRGKFPTHYSNSGSGSERETVLRTETKEGVDWKADMPPSFMLVRSGSSLQRGKDKSFHNMVGEIVAQIRDAENGPQSAMVNSINAFVESPVGQVFSATIDRALEKTEEWLNYYLPLPNGSPEQVETPVGSEEMCTAAPLELYKEGCFMRINSLSMQLRSRAFNYLLRHLKATRQSTGQNLSLLDEVLKLTDNSRHMGNSNLPKIPGPLGKLWPGKTDNKGRPSATRAAMESITFLPEQLEMKALGLTRSLAQELYNMYKNLLPHVPELPLHLQEKATQVCLNLEELQSHLSLASSVRDLPASLVQQSRQRIANAKENLDEILEFMGKNPPAQWLQKNASKVAGNGPFFSLRDKPQAGASNEDASTSQKDPEPESPPTPQPTPPHL
ncbi:uncharacterized protein LOC134293085 isoform X2 [Anolis carolinensis]|uniref:uncharacterized protein LOC134293085 isoform X2 n=1 Tax=Anolis carolinensis TaxID=28377 RepID=UPI002F2B3AD5